jgi:hypothetical protein
MPKDFEKLTGDELQAEFIKFLFESTPQELALVIQDMEQREDFKSNKFDLVVKTVAFRGMLQQLKIPTHTMNRVRGVKSKLYLEKELNQSTLILTKKDKENFHLVYPKLYDQHKDELLQMIESRKVANAAREGVVR